MADPQLFAPAAPAVTVPDEIDAALREGARLAISISGGKDSLAMLTMLAEHPDRAAWTGGIMAVHSDLGRAEWPQTPAVVEAQCERLGVPLEIVHYHGGDLVDRIENRIESLHGKDRPAWPSAAARYCTSDTKRGPINKLLRRYGAVVSAEGIRAQESSARARKSVWERRKAIDNSVRNAWTWRPILHLTEAQIWLACGTSAEDLRRRRALYASGQEAEALEGWPAHPAYVYGNERLSCALCVLACQSDLRNGIRHHPTLARHYAKLERETGYTFRQDVSITDLLAEAEAEVDHA